MLSGSKETHVAIVGGGPAGLEAAQSCTENTGGEGAVTLI